MQLRTDALRLRGPHGAADAATGVDYLDDDAFWGRLRQTILPLRPSQYDVTARCNLSCEGCLFFSGTEHLEHEEETDLLKLDRLFASEAARGVRYGYFSGAEPSLVEDKLRLAARHIPYGVVFTNGTRQLAADIPYRIHVSVWGRPETDRALRGASMLEKQVRNYRGDKRAVFVFTITAQNIGDIGWIAQFCSDNDVPLTFNHYSPTKKYSDFLGGTSTVDRYHARGREGGGLVLREDDLRRSRDIIAGLLHEGCGSLRYSVAWNEMMHEPAGLYPDIDPQTGIAPDCASSLSKSFRHYNTDLGSSTQKCCTPNVSCATCRLYAQSHATALLRATRDGRQARGANRALPLWRLWCALFLNDDLLSAWRPFSAQ